MKKILLLWVVVFSFVASRTQMQIRKELESFQSKYAALIKKPVQEKSSGRRLVVEKDSIPPDPPLRYQILLHPQEAAKKGDAEAQMFLGKSYLAGRSDVPKNSKQAVFWFQKSANQGYAEGEVELTDAYHNGTGVGRDEAKAAFWYQKAAAQNNIEAEARLGFVYHQGRGLSKDEKMSFFWFDKAAHQGSLLAQTMVGVAYYYGSGVPQDKGRAFMWYQKAAHQGDVMAQYLLGMAYLKGEGVARSKRDGVFWLQRAAAQGDYNAFKILQRLQ